MFYYLDGTVAEILPYLAVIDCSGVVYACKTTNTTLAQLKKGQRGKLYTYLDVGENAFGLYGFATANELNSFKLLIGVSGVGPKAALSVLSAATPQNLALSIVTGDEKALTAALETIAAALAAGDRVQLVGFGTFETKDREARTGRNPSTGEPMDIPAARLPAFKAGKALKDAVAL